MQANFDDSDFHKHPQGILKNSITLHFSCTEAILGTNFFLQLLEKILLLVLDSWEAIYKKTFGLS